MKRIRGMDFSSGGKILCVSRWKKKKKSSSPFWSFLSITTLFCGFKNEAETCGGNNQAGTLEHKLAYLHSPLRCPPFHNSMIVIYPSWTALRLSPTYTCSWEAKINPNKQTNWIEIGTLQNVCSCKIKMLDVQEAHLGQNTERGGPFVPDPLANKSCQR